MKKIIGLRGQIILALIPSFITQIIAFYRIKKFTKGIVLEILLFLANLLINMVIPWPLGLFYALPMTVGVPVFFVRKWTREYNTMPSGMFS